MRLNKLRPKIFLYAGLLLLLCGCVRAAEVSVPEIRTAASSPAPAITASQTASATIEPTLTKTLLPTSTPKPTATPTFIPPSPLLPAPLYFLSPDDSGIDQVWRMEIEGGLSHPVTNMPESIIGYDVSKWDGSLAFVSGNDLYVLHPDSADPELIYAGEELDPEEEWGVQVSKKVYSPLWSPDGKEMAFSQNGVLIFNFESAVIRSLITNNTLGLEDPLDWKEYYPTHWSPDGRSIAVGVSYFEAGGLILLSANDGSMRSSGGYGCCDYSFPENSRYFYVANNDWHGGGFAKVDWLTGNVVWLDIHIDSEYFVLISDPVMVDDTLYFFSDSIFASASINSIPDYEVVTKAPNISGRILWAPDASLLIIQDWGMAEPMYLWSPGAGLFQLDQRGKELKWGAP